MARIEVDVNRCKGCELCVAACPCKAIGLSDQFNASGYYPCIVIHPEKCTGCGFCALVCPEMAIEVFREVKKKSKEE
jgi:2-oxoglutarate ferredoxin oxidoreductase subunit delta